MMILGYIGKLLSKPVVCRVSYYASYLRLLEQALGDGIDVRGYMAWSLLDNFEYVNTRFCVYLMFYRRYGFHSTSCRSLQIIRFNNIFSVCRWADGYTYRFGLHYVDYTFANRTRYPKLSARWYRDYIKNHRVYSINELSHTVVGKPASYSDASRVESLL